MMRKYVFLISLVLTSFLVFGQKIPPANWSYSLSQNEVKIGDIVEVTFTSPVPEGYHIYSNDYGDCPPVKAKFIYTSHSSYKLIGEAKAIGSHHYIDDIFECEVADFENKAEFRQQIQILKPDPKISGILEYQMCTSDGMCVLFDYEFVINKMKVLANQTNSKSEPIDPVVDVVEIRVEDTVNKGTVIQTIQSNLGNQSNSETGFTAYAGLVSKDQVNYKTYQASSSKDTSSCIIKTFDGETKEASASYWGLFLLAFLSGLAALLTPCVFPMIPMTVSFFMKDGSKSKAIRNGFIYGLSIVGIYVFIGTLVAILAGPAAANWLSTHWLPNVFFFLIFVIFAASFFGAFEIVLPSWLVNKADQQADKGGLVGIFFMAFTIVLVSFSCTGPIVGSILVQSAGGAFIRPLMGMLGFSLAFAIPFALFAIFPNWLNSLPASGGWLNSVKVVLGFVELALGPKIF